MELIGPVILWIGVNAVVGYAIGKSKNDIRDSILVSILLGPIGWLIAVVDKGNLRKCPFCAELVKPEAVVCRHCGKDLPQVKAAPVRPEPQPKSTKDEWIALAAFLAALVVAGVIATTYFKHENAVSRDSRAAAASQTSVSTPSADFAKQAAKLREQALLDVEPRVLAPKDSRPAAQQFPWKTNIVTTVFWIGEPQSPENPKAHLKSAWDGNWLANYGGVDKPEPSARRDYIPAAFIPRQNPFYCALPYNDLTPDRKFKPEASLVIPWFKQAYTGEGQSVCWHRWVAIRRGDRTCYAEWEDCGPFRTDHFQYAFGNERPEPNVNHGAGLDVSPAVRDYLGLAPIDVTDWRFVEIRDVPPGPWREYGENNHFVIARRQMQQNSQQ